MTLDEFVAAVERKSILLAEEEVGAWKALFKFLEASDPDYLARGDTTLSAAASNLFYAAGKQRHSPTAPRRPWSWSLFCPCTFFF